MDDAECIGELSEQTLFICSQCHDWDTFTFTLSLSHFHDAECIGDLSEQTLFICSLRHLILHKKNALLKSKTKEKKTGADPVSKFQTYENDVAHTKGAGF